MIVKNKLLSSLRTKTLLKFFPKGVYEDVDVDLTPVYEKLKKMDPDATWYNHVSGRMLLNGSTKNPEMNGTKLTLEQVVEVLKSI